MESWLKTEGFHQYLVTSAENLNISGFSFHMLLHYPGARLLPVKLQYQNGTGNLVYEISGAEPLKKRYETREMDCASLRLLFQNVWEACRELEEYLLLPEGLLLSPEYIYYRPDKREFRFCYYPDADGNMITGMRGLAEFCMRCTNHQEEEAVLFIYGLYRLLQEDSVESATLQAYLMGTSRKAEPSMSAVGVEAWTGRPEARTVDPATKDGGTMSREPNGGGSKQPCDDEKRKPSGCRNKQSGGRSTGLGVYAYGGAAVAAGLFGAVEGVRYLCLTHSELDGKLFILAGIAMIFLAYSAVRCGRSGRKTACREEPAYQKKTICREESVCREESTCREEPAYRGEPVYREEPAYRGKAPLHDMGETTVLGVQAQASADTETERACWKLNSRQEQTENIYLLHLPGVIGRKEEEVEYYLRGEGVSRKHVLLFQSGGSLYAEDLASTNGSYINGVRLKPGEPSLLKAEDVLTIGPYQYRLSYEGAKNSSGKPENTVV